MARKFVYTCTAVLSLCTFYVRVCIRSVTNSHIYIFTPTEKLLFLDIIIEDDSGEEEDEDDNVPYELTKQAVVMDMKIKTIVVSCADLIWSLCSCV